MYNPGATYRIQFHKDFTLKDLEQIIPYLQQLGVQTVYAAPVQSAAPGSMHGYDGIDAARINPEIGNEEDLRRISQTLQQQGIGWLQDIVPNHMAFHPRNAWLMDVLAKGKSSRYAAFFDILWDKGEGLMVPFLGKSLADAIDSGELQLVQQDGAYYFRYFDSHYPLSEDTGKTLAGKSPETLNQDKALLHRIAAEQHYRLCHWQETDQRINYRRFFTVNGLICLNIQDKEVFGQYHSYIKRLLDEGIISGLRIDHIDGLYDPAGYLEQLRTYTGGEVYTVVEKILEPGEALPEDWAVAGTTGYDFLALVNNLFTNRAAGPPFTRFYQQLTGSTVPPSRQVLGKKRHILEAHMQGELENLYEQFCSTGLATDPGDPQLRPAIGAFLVYCPVYRYYGNRLPLAGDEAGAVAGLLSRVAQDHPELASGIAQLRRALLEQPASGNEAGQEQARHFYQRCMQFTGPLMAKGVEDTLMYTYNCFIGHNEVGDAPDAFGISKEAFHKAMLERQAHWPQTINTTSTHDTKRGEDVRARLNVLTDLADEWINTVKQWRAMNRSLKQGDMPDANDEYFIYQTLAASYPYREEDSRDYAARISEYLVKALREAKVHTGWTEPDEAYEEAARQFALGLLQQHKPFWKKFLAFQERIQDFGIINSLAQVLLKFTCPGVPDTYQGTELWDLSLVDPDNRRPVDYTRHKQLLDGLATAAPEALWADRQSGRLKLWLVHRLLQYRKEYQTLFAAGSYVPLRTAGRYKDHILAFARRQGREWLVVAVPLQPALICREQACAPSDIDWKDTRIVLREEAPRQWTGLLDAASGNQDGDILARDLFRTLPVAFLRVAPPDVARRAGILMSITSLPAPFGIGDFGPAAKAFARFLSRSNQGYWQLLPLNPIAAGSSYSPYSSISTMAGNTLLISPELLEEEGLLDEATLAKQARPSTDKADYPAAEQAKKALLEKAYQTFRDGHFPRLQQAYATFRQAEEAWLDDYALFVVLRREQNGQPWYQWPDALKHRDTVALSNFAAAHAGEIEEVKWQQFLFSRQWRSLRAYCNGLGIKLFGDLPFYASYDSADVWMHPELFSLDEQGSMTGVAGVPPDYFSETGQLWGMPTFNWEALKARRYDWWIRRLRKNLELYDVLRIDHFRALAAYWEVPAGEETAVNGQWIKGPGTDFFDAVREAFGSLPFIAEDLGYEMEDVYKLRDKVDLPGMKVLQFGFGDDMQTSVDAPHNYSTNAVVYTGTHDNNTTLGWYRKEAKTADRQRLSAYTGVRVDDRNVVATLIRLAYASVARIAILPLQDVLELDEQARMNVPSSARNNWSWRLKPGQLQAETEARLRTLVRRYNRL